MATSRKGKKANPKLNADKHTMNPPRGRKKAETGGDQELDVKRRLGGFEGRGEHARTGNRGHQ